MNKMRIIVWSDFPAESRHQLKVAREFEEWLFSDGFIRLQPGVHTRMTDSRESAHLHLKRLRAHSPELGIVRALVITERQFLLSEMVAGQESAQELEVSSQLDIFL